MAYPSLLADAITITPNSSLPGTATIQSVLGGLMTIVLYVCGIAMAVGAGAWAFGNKTANFTSAHRGRELVFGALIGALLTGATQLLINFAFATGHSATN